MRAPRIASSALKPTANVSVALTSGSNEFTSYLKELGEIPERSSLRTSRIKCGYQHPKLVRLFSPKDFAVN